MTRSSTESILTSLASRTVLLATDQSNSVLAEIGGGDLNPVAYCAYGEQSARHNVETRLGFNGELRETNIGWYLLGNGYRAYNPKLMRFHSPDSWSPFGSGGLNAYMYCVGDPINFTDPTGHISFFKFIDQAHSFLFGGPGVTGPSRGRAAIASLPLGSMRPERTGDLAALGNIGGSLAATPFRSGVTWTPTISSVDAPAGSPTFNGPSGSPIDALLGLGRAMNGQPAGRNMFAGSSAASGTTSPFGGSTYTVNAPGGPQTLSRGRGGGVGSSRQRYDPLVNASARSSQSNVYAPAPRAQATQVQVQAEMHAPPRPPRPPRPPAVDYSIPPVPPSRQMPGGGERNYSVVRRPDGTYSQSSVWRMSLSEIQKRLRKS